MLLVIVLSSFRFSSARVGLYKEYPGAATNSIDLKVIRVNYIYNGNLKKSSFDFRIQVCLTRKITFTGLLYSFINYKSDRHQSLFYSYMTAEMCFSFEM